MGYDRGDSFPFDFEPNGIPYGSKSKGKRSPRSYPIQYEKKRKYSFISAVIGAGWADWNYCDNENLAYIQLYERVTPFGNRGSN